MLPNFIVIGGMKCGTTALWKYLQGHPQIFVPRKNIDFFNIENWSQESEWYSSFFQYVEPQVKVIGDVSTEYAKHPFRRGAPERIASLIPNAKLLYIVRHPIERMISQYIHLVNELKEKRSIEEAFLTELNKNQYIYFSMYYFQLEQYLNNFKKDQIFIVSSEQLRMDPARTMQSICCFLGVKEISEIQKITVHTREEKRRWNIVGKTIKKSPRYYNYYNYYRSRLPAPVASLIHGLVSSPVKVPALSKDLRERIVDILTPDLIKFYDFVGPDFKKWNLENIN